MTLNVFLIEDSEAIRQSLMQSLGSIDDLNIVGFADNAKDALGAILGDASIDAVIVDLQLKSGSGFEVLARLQANSRFDKVIRIVLTNYAAPIYRHRCETLGAHHFFDKSLESDKVIELLTDMVAHQTRLH